MISTVTCIKNIRALFENEVLCFGEAAKGFDSVAVNEDANVYALSAGERAQYGVAFRIGDKLYVNAQTERAACELLQKGLRWNSSIEITSPKSWILDRGREVLRRLKTKPPGSGERQSGSRLDSQKDPLLDFARSLQSEKTRRETGFCAAHGVLLAERALAAFAPIGAMLFTDRFAEGDGGALARQAEESGVQWHVITEGLMRKCVDSAYVPPVLTIVHKNAVKQGAVHIGGRFLAVAAENVEEHGNLGMIMRTADAAAADVVFVKNCDAFHWRTITGSRGSVFRLPICEIENFDFPRTEGLTAAAAATGTSTNHTDISYLGPSLFIVGNESNGLSDAALKAASHRVTIPMPGGTDSLNVAVSASVLLYEALRQREAARL